MTSLSAQILEAVGRRPEGSLLAVKEFPVTLRQAGHAVDQALRRLLSW